MGNQIGQFLLSRFLLPHLPTWILFAPFEVLRTHLQAGTIPNASSQSLLSSFRYLYNTQGIAGLYKGNSLCILYSISRFLCVVPLELLLLTARPLLTRLNVSSHYTVLISMIITLTLNQAYTYPIIFIRNEVIMNGNHPLSTFWFTLSSEGMHGLYYGLEGTYLGLLPGILVYRFINRTMFFSKTNYRKIIANLDLLYLPHLQSNNLSDSDDGEWDENDLEEEDEDLEEIIDDEDGQLPALIDLDEEDEEFFDDMSETSDDEVVEIEEIEDEVLLQVERCLARMKLKHWRQFIQIGSRAFLTRACAKLSKRLLCYPGDVIGKVMQQRHISLSDAASLVFKEQGFYGFFRGASIEFIVTPVQIALEMGITVCAIRYNWGGKLIALFQNEDEPALVQRNNFRPSPGTN